MIIYKNANNELLSNIPEIIKYLEERVVATEEPFRYIPELIEYLEIINDPNKDILTIPPHLFYGDILSAFDKKASFFYKLLNGEYRSNNELITRVFSFFENMANSNDFDVQCLLQTAVLEYLWSHAEILEAAECYMGPKTKLINDTISEYFTRPKLSSRNRSKRMSEK